MTDMQPQEVLEFVDKIKGWQLEPPERELMDAILKVATDIQEVEEDGATPAYTGEFSGAFTKTQADRVLKYADLPLRIPASIDLTIIRAPHATPAMIIKNPPDDA
jgi:hypothetical protein